MRLWQAWLIWIGITLFTLFGVMQQDKAIRAYYDDLRANPGKYGFDVLENQPSEAFDVIAMFWTLAGGFSLICLSGQTIGLVNEKYVKGKRGMKIWQQPFVMLE